MSAKLATVIPFPVVPRRHLGSCAQFVSKAGGKFCDVCRYREWLHKQPGKLLPCSQCGGDFYGSDETQRFGFSHCEDHRWG